MDLAIARAVLEFVSFINARSALYGAADYQYCFSCADYSIAFA